MLYTTINFGSRIELKVAIERGDKVEIFQPGPYGTNCRRIHGLYTVEGPHFSKPPGFTLKVKVEGGIIKEIIK